MVKSIFIVMVTLLFVCSCGEEKRDDNAAARAAKEYYDCLVAGRYAEYLDGIADMDSLPPSYREQLLANAKQFMAQQKKEHDGIVDVRAVSVRTDSVARRTSAFIMLCFGDSAKEEVVVPMVERNGRWLMK